MREALTQVVVGGATASAICLYLQHLKNERDRLLLYLPVEERSEPAETMLSTSSLTVLQKTYGGPPRSECQGKTQSPPPSEERSSSDPDEKGRDSWRGRQTSSWLGFGLWPLGWQSPADRCRQLRLFSRIHGHFADLFNDTYDDPFYDDVRQMMLECDNDD